MTDQGQDAQKILDSNPWARGLSDKLEEVVEASQDLSIYRVPSKLRKVKDDAYDPRVVSIGPLHRDNPNLLAMEEHKWRYTLFTFQQTDKFEDTIKCLQKCTDAFYGSEYTLIKKVRESYAVHLPPEIKNSDLAEMMLVDGCFILQLFLRNHQRSCSNDDQDNDPIFSGAWMLPALRHDLTLLENQIPFFILGELYRIIRPHIVKYTPPDSVATLALKFFQPMYQPEITQDTDTAGEAPPRSDHIIEVEGPAKPSNPQKIKEGTDTEDRKDLLRLLHNFFRPSSGHTIEVRGPPKPTNKRIIKEGTDTEHCKHLLHLLHNFFCPSSGHIIEVGVPAKPSNQQKKKKRVRLISKQNEFNYCASDLYDAGVQFETGLTDEPLSNIKFEDGVIKIPPFFIDDITDSLFRNLIAFEQCLLKSSHHITSYVIVIKSLIRSKEDIKLLHKKGIIPQNVAEEKYFVQFEGILDGVAIKSFYFDELCDIVNEYTRRYWFRRYIKDRYRTYFSSAWSAIVFIASILAFILTSLQTYFTMYPR